MAIHRFCDRLPRRDFLKAGAIGSGLFGGLGLDLPSYLRMVKAGEVKGPRARAAIHFRMGGGPSQMDMFDMKPDAPEEYRGELKPIQTNVPGIEFSEQLPLLAKVADKFAILRGVTHSLGGHDTGAKFLDTGNRPQSALDFPGFGSVVSKEIPAPRDLPSFVAVPHTTQHGGYLGLQYGSFATNAAPKIGEPFEVRGIALSNGLTIADLECRQRLLAGVDTVFRGYESQVDMVEGLDEFSQQAYNMISSPRAREAFDTSREPREIAERFGEHPMGMSCLLATRLVEAGVPFVAVDTNYWDMHFNIFPGLKGMAPPFDQVLAALLTTLDQRGLLETTTIMVTGEFGRTPKVNGGGGRDHHPRNMFALMAGGGIQGGQIIGASDDKGEVPTGRPMIPEDVAASFYHTLGIDAHKEYHTNTGRPVMIVRDGEVIQELFG